MSKHRSTAWRIGILLGASCLVCGCASEQDPDLSSVEPTSPEVTLENGEAESQDSFAKNLSMLEQAINNREDLSVERLDPPLNQTAATMESQPVSVLPDPPQANLPTPVSVETEAELASAADDDATDAQPVGAGLAVGSAPPPARSTRVPGPPGSLQMNSPSSRPRANFPPRCTTNSKPTSLMSTASAHCSTERSSLSGPSASSRSPMPACVCVSTTSASTARSSAMTGATSSSPVAPTRPSSTANSTSSPAPPPTATASTATS